MIAPDRRRTRDTARRRAGRPFVRGRAARSSAARPVTGRPDAARPGAAGTEAGFTLIELLVTITIVAILVGAVVINIEFRNVGKTVRDVALRTGLIMELAADQAVYARQQFGIRFHPGSYEFWILAAEEEGDEPEWTPFEDDRLRYDAPQGIALEFQVDISGVPIVLEDLMDELGDATDENPLKPHVLFLSNGEIMPDFRIVVADPDGEFRHEIRSGEVRPIVVERLSGEDA